MNKASVETSDRLHLHTEPING